MFKINNRNTRTRCEICSKLSIKTPERSHWRRSGVSIVNFEQLNAGWLTSTLFKLSLFLIADFVHSNFEHINLVFINNFELLFVCCKLTQPTFTCLHLTIETIEKTITCSKLTIKKTEQRQWRLSGIFIDNLEHISRLFPVFLLLTLSMHSFAG